MTRPVEYTETMGTVSRYPSAPSVSVDVTAHRELRLRIDGGEGFLTVLLDLDETEARALAALLERGARRSEGEDVE